MNRLAVADHYSATEVSLLSDKLASAIAGTIVLRTETDAKIRALLTLEQRQKSEPVEGRPVRVELMASSN
jgi:Spy/CpxP family protein refolding chaperone